MLLRGVSRYKVELLPHDPAWTAEFEQLKAQILAIWKDNILDIQHVGSTAVPTLCAKPILDVAILLRSVDAMNVSALEQLGYDYWGPSGDTGRYVYVRWHEDSTPDNQIALTHIHCYAPDAQGFRLQVGFRDYLIAHPDAAMEYNALKSALAAQHPDDRFAYSAGKASFIQGILAKL